MKQSIAEPKKIVLENGLRVLIHPDSRFETASVAVCLTGGLRCETPERAGITHLLEHLLFKRTTKKSPFEIARIMDRFGGSLNGFTDAESLCLHGDVPSGNVVELLELFAEMLLQGDFNDEDFEKEQEVVRQELLELIDDPGDTAYRSYCELFWPDSMLALPVCGSEESLLGITPEDVRQHLREMLVGERIVIGISGGVDSTECESTIRRLFGALPQGTASKPRTVEYGTGIIQVPRAVSQVHFVIGAPWPTVCDSKRVAAEAILSIFGDGMSSRLFYKLRDETGLVYDIDCSAEAFHDTGSFEISGVVDRENFSEVMNYICSELAKLRTEGVSADELTHVAAMSKAELVMERDSIDARMWRAIETEIVFGHYISAEEELGALTATTREECQDVLNQYLVPGSFAAAFAGDVENLEIHEELQRWCSMLQ